MTSYLVLLDLQRLRRGAAANGDQRRKRTGLNATDRPGADVTAARPFGIRGLRAAYLRSWAWAVHVSWRRRAAAARPRITQPG